MSARALLPRCWAPGGRMSWTRIISMPANQDHGAPQRAPTPYAELNAVLAHLVDGARAALGGNFVGAYLQGSFAVGDFSEWSDCDFIVVVAEDLTPDQIAPLQALHAGIHE